MSDIFRLILDGEDSAKDVFWKNKGQKVIHSQLQCVFPFNVNDKKSIYLNSSETVGAFSRLLCDKKTKYEYCLDNLKNNINNVIDKNGDILFDVIRGIYFDDDNINSLNMSMLAYNNCYNNDKIAKYIFSMFVNDKIKSEYLNMCNNEGTDVLCELLIECLPDLENEVCNKKEYECLIDDIKIVFQSDILYLISKPELYKLYIKRFLEYYFVFYILQLSNKLSKFDNAKNGIEKIYMGLSWEIISKTRKTYNYGWKVQKENLKKIFSHSIVLNILSKNNYRKVISYESIFSEINNKELDNDTADSIDISLAKDIDCLIKTYIEHISDVDFNLINYTNVIHEKNMHYKAIDKIRELFETIDYQFKNSKSRKSPYDKYSAGIIGFIEEKFLKKRGSLGYVFNITEQDIILFTQIIIGENQGRISRKNYFNELGRRGLFFDRDSELEIIDLLDRMNFLEKKSDSGDAQYVKAIL